MSIIEKIEPYDVDSVIEECEKELDTILKSGIKANIKEFKTTDEIVDYVWKYQCEWTAMEQDYKNQINVLASELTNAVRMLKMKA